jgi:protein SCO1/2
MAMRERLRRLGIAIATALLALWATTSVAQTFIDARFALTALDGKAVTEADYRGKWMLVYFGYTFCPDVCPTTLGELAAALDKLGPKADAFQPIFITLDPARDSAKVMSDYLKAFGPRFVGLRGSGMDIAETAGRFHAYFRLRGIGNGQYTVDHSSFVYVIDPKGKFVELLTPDTPGHSIAESLRKLVQ